MSYSKFSAELRPDVVLRRLVLISGVVLGAMGALMIVAMSLPAAALVAGSAVWLAVCAREIRTLRRGFAHCRALRFKSDGTLWLLDADGAWRAARLAPGSIVLRRLAWIRCVTSQGCQCAELLRGNCRQSEDWRRLQVIWRHVGGTL